MYRFKFTIHRICIRIVSHGRLRRLRLKHYVSELWFDVYDLFDTSFVWWKCYETVSRILVFIIVCSHTCIFMFYPLRSICNCNAIIMTNSSIEALHHLLYSFEDNKNSRRFSLMLSVCSSSKQRSFLLILTICYIQEHIFDHMCLIHIYTNEKLLQVSSHGKHIKHKYCTFQLHEENAYIHTQSCKVWCMIWLSFGFKTIWRVLPFFRWVYLFSNNIQGTPNVIVKKSVYFLHMNKYDAYMSYIRIRYSENQNPK